MTEQEKEDLRSQHYNGTIVDKRLFTDNLAVFQIKPDKSKPNFEPGQFVNLGLFNFETPHNPDLEYDLQRRPEQRRGQGRADAVRRFRHDQVAD